MSIPKMLTLRDGQQVPQTMFNTTDKALRELKNENFIALYHLVQKCNKESFKIPESWDSETTLKNKGLMDETGKIQPDVQKIVRNYIEADGIIIQFVNALQSKKITKM